MGPLRCIDMTSVTSPQQTGRGGADIPGPRGGQGVRLLVLGTDADAQELRDRAAAAGFELAQRYSARVSHVAYGDGIDPKDAKYSRIRDAGLAIVPIQACASQLGLGERTARPPKVVEAAQIEAAEIEVVEVEAAEAAADATEAEAADTDAEAAADEEPLEVPPLRRGDGDPESAASGLVPGFEPVVPDDLAGELAEDVGDAYAPLQPVVPTTPVVALPVTTTPVAKDLPPGAAVVGADPWTGPGGSKTGSADNAGDAAAPSERTDDAPKAPDNSPADATGLIPVTSEPDPAPVPAHHPAEAPAHGPDRDLEAADAPVTEAAASAEPAAGSADAPAGAEADVAAAPSRVATRHVLASLGWALIPFVSFGVLTPAVFCYAACRLRSRILGLAALGYTVAVVLSFALSAARPPAGSPSDPSGALLTLALATAWIGGTVHALSIRMKVFAR